MVGLSPFPVKGMDLQEWNRFKRSGGFRHDTNEAVGGSIQNYLSEVCEEEIIDSDSDIDECINYEV